MTIYAVTGGAGFIGSHIAEKLLREGHQVRVIDNLLTGKQGTLDYLAKFGDDFSHLPASITDKDALLPFLRGVDTVFHLAALPSVPLSVKNPADTHENCVTGTLFLLECAVKAGVRRVIYASSSAVYGERKAPAMQEDFLPTPISPYGAMKLAGEYYCQAFSHTYSIETVALRYFNVFGARQDPNSHYAAVVPKFITAMLNKNRPIIYGDGSQTRDFIHVDNIVEANLKASQAPQLKGEVFNIATGTRITLLELVETLNELLGTHLDPIFEPMRAGDIRHSCANISKAQAQLGYEPIVDLRRGLEKTIEAYQEMLN